MHGSALIDGWTMKTAHARPTSIARVRCSVASRVLGALVTLMAVSATANPKLLMDATKLLAEGNPKQAYMMLVAEQSKLAGSIDFDYLLGVAALDSGKSSEAIIAFERVLAQQPNNAGALMDLGRAYFTAGSLDLAEATFKQLQVSNPPEAAKTAIERYLTSIAERRAGAQGKSANAWGEVALGYDSNITGVPNDFTRAVQVAFNIPGVEPTGNSIKRKAPYVTLGVGGDWMIPLRGAFAAHLGGEARGRAFREKDGNNEGDFNSTLAELRAGVAWAQARQAWRIGLTGHRFDQEGQAPGEPKQTNNRNTATLSADYRYTLSEKQELTAGLSGSRLRFPDNDIEDINATGFNLGFTRQLEGARRPVLNLSGFFSDDKAVRKLADGVSDKSKRVGGVRGGLQWTWSESLSIYNVLGYSQRRDQSAFARATEIEFGRDRLADLALGVTWKFQPRCTLRAQWFAAKNDSNIAIYDYTRNEVSSNIRCDFF
jgi:tetratricopeptide (TPR) repeat protein